jgi:hypothetical protein
MNVVEKSPQARSILIRLKSSNELFGRSRLARNLIFFLFLASLLIAAGCDEDDPPDIDVSVETISVTASGDSIYLVGNIPVLPESSDVRKYGFLISPDTSKLALEKALLVEIPISQITKGKFRATIVNDFDDTKYYCKAFVSRLYKISYGKILSFEGQKAAITITDFTPKEGYDGSFVKIQGSNFNVDMYGDQKIFLDELEAEIISTSVDRIVFKVPPYKVAGPVKLSIKKNGVRYESEKLFTLKGPEVESFLPAEGSGVVRITVNGKYFSDQPWRNTVSLVNPLYLKEAYNGTVIAVTMESLTVEINTTNIQPGNYRIGVTVNDKLSLSSESFSVTSKWTLLNLKPENGLANSANFQIGNKLYFCTGLTEAGYTNQVWEYDVTLDVWTRKSDFPGAKREGAVGFALNGKGYVGMGTTPNDTRLGDFWEYNSEADQWTQKSEIPDGVRSFAWAVLYEGKAYVLMGSAAHCCHQRKDFWSYDPDTDMWERLPDFGGYVRTHSAVVVHNDKLYVIGGSHPSIGYTIDSWSFDFTSRVWTAIGPLNDIYPFKAFSYNGKCYLVHHVQNYLYIDETRLSEFAPEANAIVEDLPIYPGAFSWRPGLCLLRDGVLYYGLGPAANQAYLKELWKFSF